MIHKLAQSETEVKVFVNSNQAVTVRGKPSREYARQAIAFRIVFILALTSSWKPSFLIVH